MDCEKICEETQKRLIEVSYSLLAFTVIWYDFPLQQVFIVFLPSEICCLLRLQLSHTRNGTLMRTHTGTLAYTHINVTYLPTIPECPELLRKIALNYGITARGRSITDILDYGNLVTSGNNR